MARKKETPKPMFDLRHDFVASLENLCQECIMMLQAVDGAIEHGKLADPVKSILEERYKALRAALVNEEN